VSSWHSAACRIACLVAPQVSWSRVLAHLQSVAGMVGSAADRAALMTAQDLAPALCAVFKMSSGQEVQPGTELQQLLAEVCVLSQERLKVLRVCVCVGGGAEFPCLVKGLTAKGN
jgi:hypothetical protein